MAMGEQGQQGATLSELFDELEAAMADLSESERVYVNVHRQGALDSLTARDHTALEDGGSTDANGERLSTQHPVTREEAMIHSPLLLVQEAFEVTMHGLKLSESMRDAIRETRFLAKPNTMKALQKREIMTDAGTLTPFGEHVRIHVLKWPTAACPVCVAQVAQDAAEAAQAAPATEYITVEPNDFMRAIVGGILAEDNEREMLVRDLASSLGMQPYELLTFAGFASDVHDDTMLTPAQVAWVKAIVASNPEHTGDASTWELPGDAERAWDADNAAAERADIESEYAAEAEAERAFPGGDAVPFTLGRGGKRCKPNRRTRRWA